MIYKTMIALSLSYLLWGNLLNLNTMTGLFTKSEKIDKLQQREGDPPEVGGYVPHQQYSNNSPESIMINLQDYLFNLPGVIKVKSRVSIDTSLGAYLDESIIVNPRVEREFTHIHTEPGPGSMHMMLPREVCQQIINAKWGVYHPMSKHAFNSKTSVVLVYAPRNEKDLEEIKKIIDYAYKYAVMD